MHVIIGRLCSVLGAGLPSLKSRCFSPPPLDLRSLFAAPMPEYPAVAPASFAPTAPGSRAAAGSAACCSSLVDKALVVLARILRHGGCGDADPRMLLLGLAMSFDGAACCLPWASSLSRGSACGEDSEASSPLLLLPPHRVGASTCISSLVLLRVALPCRDDADTAASTIPRGMVRTAASIRPCAPGRCCQPPLSPDGDGEHWEHAAGAVLSIINAAATISHARPLFMPGMALPNAS